MSKHKPLNPSQKQVLGRWGEDQAGVFIKEQGITILGSNVRTPYGEIDIIGLDQEQVVFFEVKTRSNINFENPENSVKEKKKTHLIKSADAYMQEHEELPDDWRIDVIAIIGSMNGKHPEIEWFKNAVD